MIIRFLERFLQDFITLNFNNISIVESEKDNEKKKK